MRHIFKCLSCGKYTMKEVCACGIKTSSSRPAKYSPEDNYGSYRRKAKREQWEKEGLI